MATFKESRLWQDGLSARSGDPHEKIKERLRAELRTFRQNAAFVAAEIARDLPYFTVHDISHIDALWRIGSEIAGSDLELTPAETFVLGGAFLVHDLGMAVASYPKGPAEIEQLPEWETVLMAILRRETGMNPTAETLAGASEDARREATQLVLRRRHATHAEKLATDPIGLEGGNARFLLENTELRNAFGRVIGRVAHSHWWPVERLPKEFSSELNAPAGFPGDWTIDPLKLACLLRTADASHLDRLRAPSLLRMLRNPPGVANDHWVFQGALDPPCLHGDRLRFTASRDFPVEDSDAWWLCLDALRQADRELQQVDSLLADLGRRRFAAKGVLGVDAPKRLEDLIPTDGWIPVEAKIEVSDVAQVIDRLGGAKLYGDQLAVPLRELVQNAVDATELRASLGGKTEPMLVVLKQGDDGEVLEVSDYGAGMSPAVLTGALLDFGVSLWSDDALIDEFPGLAAERFTPTGAFGIGFFSVFMWSESIKVISRRFDAALADTYVLELANGPGGRPLLRRAVTDEQRAEPGTTVRLELSKPLQELAHGRFEETFVSLCGRVAPALGVSLVAEDGSGEPTNVVAASDWLDMPGVELLGRLQGEQFDERAEATAAKIAENLRTIHTPDGAVAGRLALLPAAARQLSQAGALVVGGLRVAGLPNFAGVLQGTEPTAARNEARSIAGLREMALWASTQAKLVAELVEDPMDGMVAANMVGELGGETGTLPICETADGFLSFTELQDWARTRDHALVLDLSYGEGEYYEFAGTSETLVPADDVVILHVSGWDVPSLLHPPPLSENPTAPVYPTGNVSLIDHALAMGWGLDRHVELYGNEEEWEARWDTQPPRPIGTVEGRTISIQYYMLAAPQ